MNERKPDDFLEEKLRKDLEEKGYVDRKEFTKYMRRSPFKTEEDVNELIIKEEKNPFKKVLKAFILSF